MFKQRHLHVLIDSFQQFLVGAGKLTAPLPSQFTGCAHLCYFRRFYLHDTMLAWVLAVVACLCVSVCLSYTSIVSKWLNFG